MVLLSLYLAMIIGFAQRIQTVLEVDAPYRAAGFDTTLYVHSLRSSDVDFDIKFRYQESSSTANVKGYNQLIPHFDAQFGHWDSADDTIVYTSSLPSGSFELKKEPDVFITNDNIVESQECFTISIMIPDIKEYRAFYTCNRDECNPSDFFCLHTICIEDGNGLCIKT